MADLFSIDVDATGVLAKMDAVGDRAEALIKDASEETANRVRYEQRLRIARRTGETAARLIVEETNDGKGYVVTDDNAGLKGRDKHIEWFIEKGTMKMTSRPFFDNTVKLEEGPHVRRVSEALQRAIEETGLGE